MNEDYPVFVKWFEATDWILDRVEKFPKSVRFTISGRIANMAIDVMEGIIEAIYTKDRAYILGRINLYMTLLIYYLLEKIDTIYSMHKANQ